jgi:hypothetical protein
LAQNRRLPSAKFVKAPAVPFAHTVAGRMHHFPELETSLSRAALVVEGTLLRGALPPGKERWPGPLSFKAPRVWLSKPFVLSFETVIRPATLPKLDNGVEFQVVSMVNRLRQFASREELYCALLFSL